MHLYDYATGILVQTYSEKELFSKIGNAVLFNQAVNLHIATLFKV